MSKYIIRFFSILSIVTLVFLALALYRDVTVNKLFNYSSKPRDVSYERKAKEDGVSTREDKFSFTAADNFLGAVIIPVKYLGIREGDVIFKIKEATGEGWFHQDTYDYSYFRNFDTFIFGFPVIEESDNVKYEVFLSFTGDAKAETTDIVDQNPEELFMAKYVFPKRIVLENPVKVIDIAEHRILFSAKGLDYQRIVSTIFVVTVVFLYISNAYILRGERDFKSVLVFIKAVLNPKYSAFFACVALLLILAVLPLVILGKFSVAETVANYIWIFLFFGLVWYVFSSYLMDGLKKIYNLAVYIYTRYFLSLKSVKSRRNIILVLILTIFAAGLKRTYYLGGDDSKLYYLYPKEFLVNFAAKIVSDTSMSSVVTLAPPVLAPFAIIMTIFKEFVGPLNLQAMLYTANVIGGLVFFYMLLDWLIPVRSKFSCLINSVASFIYVFSIFNSYTLFNSQLIAIYLVSLFPLLIYVFLKAVKENKLSFLFIFAIVGSVFCLFTLASPWSFAVLIALLPFILYFLWKYKIRTLKYLIILGTLLFILNFHWLIYLPYNSNFNKSSGVFKSSVVSTDFRQENARGVRVVSETNSVFYPLMNTYHQAIQRDFNWSFYPIFQNWSAKILPFNILFIGLILTAGLYLNKNDSNKKLYVSALLSFLLAVFMYTVNITQWGINFFVWLNNNIPGFVLFRNMYDKFAYAVAFTFALIFAVSLHIIFKKINSQKIKKYVVVTFAILAILNSKPLLFGDYNRAPLWTTKNTYSFMRSFNDDFLELSRYIKNVENPGKYLILPLTTGNALSIQDKYLSNHYYNGVSPLLVMTGKNDFSGILSFGDFGKDIVSLIKDKDYYQLGKIMQKLNVKYVIVNNQVSTDLQNSFVYSEGIYHLQSKEMISSLVGEKIRDFGQRYSLYEINKEFDSEKVYLTNDANEIPNDIKDLRFTKLDSHLYEIDVSSLKSGDNLIFLDPYLDGWELIWKDRDEPLPVEQFVALDYANGWKIGNLGGNHLGESLKLYFKPFDYYWPANIVSIVGYLLSFAVILKNIVKSVRR